MQTALQMELSQLLGQITYAVNPVAGNTKPLSFTDANWKLVWGIFIHNIFVHPSVLFGVMTNVMESKEWAKWFFSVMKMTLTCILAHPVQCVSISSLLFHMMLIWMSDEGLHDLKWISIIIWFCWVVWTLCSRYFFAKEPSHRISIARNEIRTIHSNPQHYPAPPSCEKSFFPKAKGVWKSWSISHPQDFQVC